MNINMVPPGQDFIAPDPEEFGDYAVVHAPDHHRAIALDRQAGRIGTEIIVASSRIAMLAQDVGTVVTIFDRARVSVGPRGFSTPLLSSLFEVCDGLAVLAYRPHDAEPYEWASRVAQHTGGVALIVETTPEFQQAWMDCARYCRHPNNWLHFGPKAQGVA